MVNVQSLTGYTRHITLYTPHRINNNYDINKQYKKIKQNKNEYKHNKPLSIIIMKK